VVASEFEMGAENGKRNERENRAGDLWEFGGGAEDCSSGGDEAVGRLCECGFGPSGIDLSMERESRKSQRIPVGD
jgi:hypothetical protein